jgi:exopolyphosphatase / guanosine-5'-triphosphate,3'-diphosphate pyrophosphatase
LQAFENIFARLLAKNRVQRMQIPGMIEMRVDMIVVACCLIDFLIQKHTFKNIRASTYSLKEGVLTSLTTP